MAVMERMSQIEEREIHIESNSDRTIESLMKILAFIREIRYTTSKFYVCVSVSGSLWERRYERIDDGRGKRIPTDI